MAEEVLAEFQHSIAQLTLIPGRGGVFEVLVGDNLVFSKKALGRHAAPGEIPELVAKALNQQ